MSTSEEYIGYARDISYIASAQAAVTIPKAKGIGYNARYSLEEGLGDPLRSSIK